MNAKVAVGDTVTRLEPGASLDFAHVSNEDLLAGTRRLVGRSNQLLAALLAHLGEVEARGVFRKCSCNSLYTYCIYELRFSEDEASRRASAAKLVRRFPTLLEAIAKGELHLTGLLMLGPVLTDENAAQVLGRAKFRTKKEIGKLVRTLAPLPRVPDRIEPLGPELPRALRNPTWAEFVESLCPPVRELRPGQRPADWANDTDADDVGAVAVRLNDKLPAPARVFDHSGVDSVVEIAAPARVLTVAGGAAAPARVFGTESGLPEGNRRPAPARVLAAGSASLDGNGGPAPARVFGAELGVPEGDARSALARGEELALARVEGLVQPPTQLEPLTEPQLYLMQLTVTEEHVRLVERAKALLRDEKQKSLAELHLQAMRLLVEKLEKKRFGAPGAQRRRAAAESVPSEACEHGIASTAMAEADEASRQRAPNDNHPCAQPHPRQRGRYISAAIRREVFERDEGQCTYTDDRAVRCRECGGLDFHHLDAFGKGGESTAANVTLRCEAHNELAAEIDFGREHMAQKRAGYRHESATSVARSCAEGDPDD